ncbi:hypothetical protein [Tepidiforma thermophila]|uniref:Uncharacterized protein n=1 Tax=Tepidiforma thermophila (strain KCTC 52669 / CGMCC 1.13589 / G233) TaxID=2761530 RepID=A0A2A9HDU4_TEPT2|nr:hypothetical protein [Tepidiforma thermophila]PFG73312.1 hypothetical protein A9A59_0507 [Tepidiforma thermophila]
MTRPTSPLPRRAAVVLAQGAGAALIAAATGPLGGLVAAAALGLPPVLAAALARRLA